jgi:hypothetical protein
MAPLCSSGEGSTHRNARVSTRVASAARAAYLKTGFSVTLLHGPSDWATVRCDQCN